MDVLSNVSEAKINVLDRGFVRLIDCLPRIVPDDKGTADYAVAEAARVSFGKFDSSKDDAGLIRYLMRHRHTTPFEMVSFKFHCRVPIFIARQWMRHRTGSFNEVSGRYTEFKDDFYEVIADQVRRQSRDNKQGSSGALEGDAAAEFAARSRMGPMLAHEHYGVHVREGVAKEQARMLLPMSLFTEFVWRVDLHNLLHFLDLRCDSHAQQEIREYGEALLKLITQVVPICVSAWQDYSPFRDGLLLSKAEVEHIRSLLGPVFASPVSGLGRRENAEWLAKAARLGFDVPDQT